MNQPANADQNGAWELLPGRLPLTALHAALLPGGGVMFSGDPRQGGAGETPNVCLWKDPARGNMAWRLPSNFSFGAQGMLPDGRLILIGGSNQPGATRLKQTFLYDPAAREWIKVGNIPGERPGPTLSGLADGRLLAAGGPGAAELSAYDRLSGWSRWSSAELDWPMYPQLCLLQDGSLFYSGQHFGGHSLLAPGLLKPDGAYRALEGLHPAPAPGLGVQGRGAMILLPPAGGQKAMVIPAGQSSSAVDIVDFSKDQPTVAAAGELETSGPGVNLVLLPDATVLACGEAKNADSRSAPVSGAWLYQPSAGQWRRTADSNVTPGRPSVAVLLPDGKVLKATAEGPSGASSIEIYHPPYLFRGERPRLEAAPEQISHGRPFTIRTVDSDISSICLVRSMAGSHGADSNQRLVDLPFKSAGPGTLEVTPPSNANLAPAGQYLMFLRNHRGAVSIGKWVRVLAEARPVLPPEHSFTETADEAWSTAPTGLAGVAATEVLDPEPAPEPVLRAAPAPVVEPVRELMPEPVIEPPLAPIFKPAAPALPQEAPVKAAPGSPAPSLLEPAVEAALKAVVAPSLEPAFVPGLDPAVEAALDTALRPAPEPALKEELEVEDSGAPAEDVHPETHWEDLRVGTAALPAKSGWVRWARPGLVIAAAGLLVAGIGLQIQLIRVPAAFIFLLFGPGLAVTGFFNVKDRVAELALIIGLSLAVETVLSLALLYMGAWSWGSSFLILLALSLTGAFFQLMKAASYSYSSLGAE